jgi:hypothetical protein
MRALALILLAACGGAAAPPVVVPQSTARQPAVVEPVASRDPTPKEKPKPGTYANIHVSETMVEINGVSLSSGPTLEDLEQILGKADRVLNLANNLHVYDRLGVVLYVPKGTNSVIDVSAFFAREDFAFMPQNLFSGEYLVEGEPLRAGMKIHDVKRIAGVRFDGSGGSPYVKDVLGAPMYFGTPYGQGDQMLGHVSIAFRRGPDDDD